MDFHKIENITVEDVLNAHMADLAVQDKYGVKYHQFWVNQKAGTVFCLTEGPNAQTCEMVHQIAHGNVACAMTEVETGYFKLFMGEGHHVDHGVVRKKDGTVDLGYRSILIASARGIATAKDSRDLQLPHWAKTIAAKKITEFNGREVKWDGVDCLIGVFNETTDAVKCACQIQHSLLDSSHDDKVIFKIGLSADQPVTKDGEFFTKAIQLAHRLCNTAEDNQILTSSLIKSLCEETVLPADANIKYLDMSEEQFVSTLLDIAHKNLSNQSFSIAGMCKDIGVSRPQLYRKVTSLTGRAPNDFLRDLRLEKALGLLKQKTGNVAQVALEVGYNNPSYFAKCFFDKFGCTPSEISIARHP